jgi:hypothetical protein
MEQGLPSADTPGDMAPSLSTDGRDHVWRPQMLWALLAMLLISFLSYYKGYNPVIQGWGQPYWVVNYSHGLIKRGLLGQVFSFLFHADDLNRHWAAVLVLHSATALSLLAALLLWVRECRADRVLVAVVALFATSQFAPTLAYLTGYLDVYLYTMFLVGALLCVYERYLVTALLGLIGPFIHESFLFVWLPLVILLFGEGSAPRTVVGRTGVVGTAVVATAVVYVLHSQDAAVAVMAAAPLDQGIKDGMLQNQFSQTITSLLRIMRDHYRNNLRNVAVSWVFFGLPTATLLWVYLRGRMLDAQRRVLILLAALSPLSILIFAWDLSRFLVGATFSALVVVLYVEARWRPVRVDPRGYLLPAWVVCAFYFLAPFVYAYFEVASVINAGLLPLNHWPVTRFVSWVFTALYGLPTGS